MAEVKLSPPPRRSCAESIAFRTMVSPPRPRQQVRFVGPPIFSRVKELRELMEYPFPEPVWVRIGQTALDDNDPIAIAEAIDELAQVKVDHLASIAKRRAKRPLLYPSQQVA